MRLAIVALGLLGTAACGLTPVAFGRPCDADLACADGYDCDLDTGLCAPAADAGPDAVDAGTVVVDAGTAAAHAPPPGDDDHHHHH